MRRVLQIICPLRRTIKLQAKNLTALDNACNLDHCYLLTVTCSLFTAHC
jgi:hypothetical protein